LRRSVLVNKEVALSRDLLNSRKIMFHYGKIMEDIANGRTEFSPVSIEIHPTARCNHRCVHCSYKERNESRVSISEEIMDKLIDSVIRMGVRGVYFSGGGEPTLYPKLADYISKLYDKGVECAIITNGSCFEQMGLISVADKLNYIAISVPAVDETRFMEITKTDNLSKVLALPGQIKAVHGDKSPIIGSRIIITNQNYREVANFLRVIKESRFDYALFKAVRDYEDNGLGLSKKEEDYILAEISELDIVDDNFTNIKNIFGYKKDFEHRGLCWTNQYGLIANVSTDGKVYPNIVEIDHEEFCIGDLNEQTLDEMWNSERHRRVKELSNQKWQRSECKNCRAMSYNRLIQDMQESMPKYFDPFI
jgi:radical SAM protein with 4Fe4S-binding SPASM domain